MEIVIIVLVIIIILLITYLFLVKKDLKRICKDMKRIKEQESNNLIHGEIPLEELNELINEINNLVSESKNAKIDYEIKNRELKKMVTNISHDLRTPLTSALGYIDILLSSQEVTKDKKTLKIIEERLKRLESLINSFFEFSKVTLQDKSVIKEEVNLIAILEESMANYYDDYRKENRKIIFENKVQKIKVKSNREMLIRVFDNLIGNAFKHSKGNLFIKLSKKEKIKIEFTNDLLDYDLDIIHVFDEFYTVDIARSKENTGLGLAIVKKFTESLNGKVTAKKEKNQFTILLEFEVE